MDISFCRRFLQLAVLAMFLALLGGCTETATAYIRIVPHSDRRGDQDVQTGLNSLGWNAAERTTAGESIYRQPSLPNYFLRMTSEKQVIEIAFVGVGTKRFSVEAINAYRSLVAVLRTNFADAVKYDVQTSSAQPIFEQ